MVGMELAPCPGQVVKASSGHIPQPFVISSKELAYRSRRTPSEQAGRLKDKPAYLARQIMG